MQVIPVLDIQRGCAVHGIGGERNTYKPVNSVLASGSNPFTIAKAFKETLGLSTIYIADLDAIEQKGNNFDIIDEIKHKLGVVIMLDPGIRRQEDLGSTITDIADILVLGTETLRSPQVIQHALTVKPKDNIIASIDMKEGAMLSSAAGFQNPISAVREIHRIGIGNFIVLDIKQVGSMNGIAQGLHNLLAATDDLDIMLIPGGGIRSIQDIMSLQVLGISAALVATALHKGDITAADLVLVH